MERYFSRIIFTLILAVGFMAAPASAKTAADVTDKKTLKNFVMSAKDRLERASSVSGLFSTLREFRESKTWNDGAIYLFIMQRPSGPQGGEIVVFNAHNSSLEGTTLHVTDVDDKDVGHAIDKAVYHGDGFVEYKWDNPLISGDEVSGKGRASGTSLKVGYGVNVRIFGEDFVLGSGFYPDLSSSEHSHSEHSHSEHSHKEGCAIVTTETGNSSQDAMVNLLLIVSSLFLAVSFKNRLEGK